jgi:hypothetical protein
VARSTVLAFCAAALLPACGGGDDDDPLPGPQPDFSLENHNPTPAPMTSGPFVSPRDFLGNVSAYYFGHAN